jgi:hypothetical protein
LGLEFFLSCLDTRDVCVASGPAESESGTGLAIDTSLSSTFISSFNS